MNRWIIIPVTQRLCLFVGLLLLSSSVAFGADEARLNVQVDQGSLSIDARDAPLADVLKAIGEKAGFATTSNRSYPAGTPPIWST